MLREGAWCSTNAPTARSPTQLPPLTSTGLGILVKFPWHVPDFPIYSNGTKPGALHEALDYATPQEVETEYYLTQPINTGP